MHFSSLPSPHGIGDIADAALAFADDLASMALRVWQFLPTAPTGYGNSPYQPLSAFAGNEMLIGLGPLIRRGLLRDSEARPLADLPRESVDFGRLLPLKQALLSRAAERFSLAADARTKSEFDDFLGHSGGGWLHDYALFRVLKTMHGERPWTEWDSEYAHREARALQRFEAAHREAIEQIRILQFFFDRQWQALKRHTADKGIRLFGDVPIYISLDSADAWADRDMLQLDRRGRPTHVAGVPPDYFSKRGQLWGNPLYDWDYLARTGYRWWIERMRRAMQMCELVRVDHFRGFESYWAVPRGARTARKGAWRPGPGDSFFVALREALGSLPIVAEDLGMITEEVERLRQRHHFPGMKVLQFEVEDSGFDPTDIPEDCYCCTATHDNDTTAGWFSGAMPGGRRRSEVRARQGNALRLTGGSPETIHSDMIRLAFSTRARVAAAPMQDYLGLGSEARMNVPGTALSNWRWRLSPGQLTPAVRERVAGLVAGTSRE